jgi:CheY-like chemotaxis protein
MRLLIADDDSDMRQSMKLLLERAGHEVELAVDGADALQIQRARAFDVLITDIFMGEADGLVAIESFRREFPATRIIAMSGGSGRLQSRGYLAAAGIAGADVTLRKPFSMATLLEMLGNLGGASTPPPALGTGAP